MPGGQKTSNVTSLEVITYHMLQHAAFTIPDCMIADWVSRLNSRNDKGASRRLYIYCYRILLAGSHSHYRFTQFPFQHRIGFIQRAP
jgi:hypothetical protein